MLAIARFVNLVTTMALSPEAQLYDGIDNPEEIYFDQYINESDESSVIKNICISDATVGHIIFQVLDFDYEIILSDNSL